MERLPPSGQRQGRTGRGIVRPTDVVGYVQPTDLLPRWPFNIFADLGQRGLNEKLRLALLSAPSRREQADGQPTRCPRQQQQITPQGPITRLSDIC